MTLENIEIRQLVAEKQIPYYVIAERIGVSPEHLSKCMRRPLKQEMKERILSAIEGKDNSQTA